jgi:hypothetical protein
MDNYISYSISCENHLDGKSVCLWRDHGNICTKIARFQDDESAKAFAEDFNFPLSENVKRRLYK